MKAQKFGIEIEMTGLTREAAAKVIAAHFGTTARDVGGMYSEWAVLDTQGRKWKVVSDGSIHTEIKENGNRSRINKRQYSVEVVSPICTYDDIDNCCRAACGRLRN
jgi:hypothetical protein